VGESLATSSSPVAAPSAEVEVKQALATLFERRGVELIFGNPGSTELNFLAGLPERVRYVMALQEASVTAMAAGYVMRTGRTPVVSLHTAPGLGNAIGALHNLLESRLPAVVVVGQQDSRHLAAEPALSFDLVAMAAPVTKWAHQPLAAADVPAAFEKAFRIAESGVPGPVLLSIPMDFFEGPAAPVPVAELVGGGGIDQQLAAAVATQLSTTASPAIVTGADVELTGAWHEAIELAEAIEAAVYTAPFQPTPGFPTAHPRYASSLPFTSAGIAELLGRHSHVLVLGAPVFRVYPYSDATITDMDTAFTVISNDSFDIGRVAAGRARIIESPLAPALRAILEQLPHSAAEPWRERRPAPAHATSATDGPIAVKQACQAIAAARPDGAVLVDESISSGVVLAKYWRTEEPRTNLRSASGGLGFAMPASVGAALAADGATVVCVIGDGSFSYSPQALWTAAEHELPVKTVVLRNGGYKVLADYHASVSEHLGELPSMRIGHVDSTAIASGWGVPARRVSNAADLDELVQWLYATPGPALLEIEIEWSQRSMFS
jgi:benzoylformate decarboxylase